MLCKIVLVFIIFIVENVYPIIITIDDYMTLEGLWVNLSKLYTCDFLSLKLQSFYLQTPLIAVKDTIQGKKHIQKNNGTIKKKTHTKE